MHQYQILISVSAFFGGIGSVSVISITDTTVNQEIFVAKNFIVDDCIDEN